MVLGSRECVRGCGWGSEGFGAALRRCRSYLSRALLMLDVVLLDVESGSGHSP